MTLQTFKSTDFDVFTVDGLEERMSTIKTNIHPKLEALGEQFAEYLSKQTDENFFIMLQNMHAAKSIHQTILGLLFQQINEDIKCYHIFKLVYGVLTPSYTLV